MNYQHVSDLATKQYFKDRGVHPTKMRSFDGLTVSALAVGTYLGETSDDADRLYEQALIEAARHGINFFDTAVNYRCQRSERNIAYTVLKLNSLGIPRDQLVIATKGGFLPAEGSPQDFKNYILKCYLNTGIISPDDIVQNCHCMTPKYIQSQIVLSLSNLKLKCVDLYYLHNPEIQMEHLGEKKFYTLVRKVFELLEKNVSEGKIRRYGIATWDGFRRGFGEPARLDVEKLVACAQKAGGNNHHFKAIQLPYNLSMLEAAAITNQMWGGERVSVIAAAHQSGLHVMISAPLMQSHLLKLPQSLYDQMPGGDKPLQKALQFVLSSPGVTAAMVGMKSVEHVRENLAVLQSDNWPVEDLQKIVGLLIKPHVCG